ncbi:zinc knuckle protein, partial [Gregarina niphandrodes]
RYPGIINPYQSKLATAAGSIDAAIGHMYVGRFAKPVEMDTEKRINQWVERVTRPLLPEFTATDEREFEDRVDQVAQIIAQQSLETHEPSLVTILLGALPAHLKHITALLTDEETQVAEAFLSKVARTLFPFSTYADDHFAETLNFAPSDLPQLPIKLRAGLYRLVRLMARWEHYPQLTAKTLRGRILSANSEAYCRRFRDTERGRPLLEVLTELHGNAKRSGIPVFATAGDQGMTGEEQEEGEVATSPCCGVCDGAHYAKHCPYKEYTCHNCGVRGHFARKCRVRFISDAYGRPAHRVETNRSGRFQVKVGGDKTPCIPSLRVRELLASVFYGDFLPLLDLHQGSSCTYL